MLRNSIRSKLIGLMLVATMVPTGISVTVAYFFTKSSVTEKSIAENTRILALGEANISNYLGSIHQLAMSIYSGINLPNSMYTSILNAKRIDPVQTGVGLSDNRDVIANQLYNMYQSNKDIYQIHLFVKANQQSNTVLNGFFRRERDVAYTPDSWLTSDKHPVMEPVHLDHRYGLKSSVPNLKPGTTKVFSVHLPIFRAPSDEVMAYLSIDLRLAGLEAIMKSMFDPQTEQLVLLNEQGEALYASDAEQTGKTILIGSNPSENQSASGYFPWKSQDFDGIVFFERIDSPLLQGRVMKLVRYQDLYGDTRKIAGINVKIGILVLMMSSLAAVLVSFRFISPIKKLIAYAQKIQVGQFDAQIHVRSEDEIGLLTRKITNMTKTIHHLIENEYKLEIANKTNQLKALQAQIHPHFLYNALQSIATTSLRYQAVQVYDLIHSLGSMMRYAMTTEETGVSMECEIEQVRHYLLLQQERFGEELIVHMDIEEEVKSIYVPKMILQPLVENVFKHGFADGIQAGKVNMEIKLEEARILRIIVSDNGKGMSSERMAQIEAALLKKAATADMNIGLFNVLARLRLYFSEEVELSMLPNVPEGLTVALRIPIASVRTGGV